MKNFPNQQAGISAAAASGQVLQLISSLLQNIYHGSLALTVQNSCLIQLERQDKFSLEALNETMAGTPVKAVRRRSGGCPSGSADSEMKQPPDRSSETVQSRLFADKINAALRGLEFGQITIWVRKGRITRIERIIKERLSGFDDLELKVV